MLGSVITGDFQRNRQIQPLEQRLACWDNMIANNRSMENQRIANEKSQAETAITTHILLRSQILR